MADSQSRVLVVDDIEENLRVLSETLTQHGFYPLQAKSGSRAIEICRRAQPDLILLDIQMPGLNGFETIAKLKEDDSTRDIPVIFISALADVDDKVRGFQAGGVDYVSKPFREEEVIARVDAHIKLRNATRQIEEERKKSDQLLRNVIPDPIIEQLKSTGTAPPRTYDDVTVLFTDIVNFTGTAESLNPEQLIGELNDLFTAFDRIIAEAGCERIKTIGDAYLAVGGMSRMRDGADTDHPSRIVQAALQMRDYVAERDGLVDWQIRVGVHTGEIVGGIVGTQKYLFDIFGDTVNTASRMESLSEPMEITISGDTADRVGSAFVLSECAPVTVKGKGEMRVTRVTGLST